MNYSGWKRGIKPERSSHLRGDRLPPSAGKEKENTNRGNRNGAYAEGITGEESTIIPKKGRSYSIFLIQRGEKGEGKMHTQKDSREASASYKEREREEKAINGKKNRTSEYLSKERRLHSSPKRKNGWARTALPLAFIAGPEEKRPRNVNSGNRTSSTTDLQERRGGRSVSPLSKRDRAKREIQYPRTGKGERTSD